MTMKIDLAHVAKLANLTLSPEEKALYGKQLEEIVDYVSKLNEVNTEKVEPTAHITGLENIGREDEAAPSLTQEDAISQALKTHNGAIVVDAVFEEQDT
jgi:aspartyl-tRNA(Asn)/glutamyl-tRNA(Gln) amidotransferase subunit C